MGGMFENSKINRRVVEYYPIYFAKITPNRFITKFQITIYIKQLLDEVFVISKIIEVKVSIISRHKDKNDNTYRDLDNSGYQKTEFNNCFIIHIASDKEILKNVCFVHKKV